MSATVSDKSGSAGPAPQPPAEATDSSGSSSRHATNEEILRELCSVNGLTYERLHFEGPQLQAIEVFFSGFPRIIPMMAQFPNLVSLAIVEQDVSKIECLDKLTKLKTLWIAECKVTVIENLTLLLNLQKLYLYDNLIRKIENLDHLVLLETLWLNGNRIHVVEGLSTLSRLTELNLAGNYIEKIGHALDALVLLEDLNLSGNRIAAFKDVTLLTRLPKLRQLSLNDPTYDSNPVCQLCNYTTHMLYHLPHLARLDTHDVTSACPFKELAQATVAKKKMFYHMKLKTLRRKCSVYVKKLGELKDQHLLRVPRERLRELWRACKQLELMLAENAGAESPSPEEQQQQQQSPELAKSESLILAETKQEALLQRIRHWTDECDRVEQHYKEWCDLARAASSTAIGRLVTELETGGNVRFEDGTPGDDAWYSSCYDLVLSRFCANDYKLNGVEGIKIGRITRVYNRMLRLKFDRKVQALEERYNVDVLGYRPPNVQNNVEYLFWVWDPEMAGGLNEPARVCEDGFLDADSYKKLGKHGAVHLSNSVYLADKPRMEHVSKATNRSRRDHYPQRYGQLIIVKTYIGRSEAAMGDGKLISQSQYPTADSVYRPAKTSGHGIHPLLLSAKQLPPEVAAGMAAGGCECVQRQCEWFLFNKDLAVPEYVVDFEYIGMMKQSNPFSILDFLSLELPSALPSQFSVPDDRVADESVLRMKPELPDVPRQQQVTDDMLLRLSGAASLASITDLSLHGAGLSKLKGLQVLTSLKKLIVSFNELTRLDDIAYLPLENLDASFNRIVTLDGVKNMTFLRYFDISWNSLRHLRDEIALIRKHMPAIEILDVRHNPWLKPTDVRLRLISRVKSLCLLDGEKVAESETTAALRLAAGSRVSQVHLLSHARTDLHQPRTLSLHATAQVLVQSSRCVPDRVIDHEGHWLYKITSLNLDGQHLSKLSNMDQLENLKWASFCDNDIVKMEGLEACTRLEELSLDNNCIYKIEGVGSLVNLRRLSLCDNFLTVIDSSQLDKLTHLHYLALDANKIQTMAGLQKVRSLIELYVSQNRIGNLRDILFLKGLQGLMILDLSENPVALLADSYRMFVVYHLHVLKALDGIPVDNYELNEARETLGGRLTTDFVAERVGHANFSEMRELDFPQCCLKSVDLGSGDLFKNLRSLNLENNSLTSLGGLVNLTNLRVLCLNHNRIESIVQKSAAPSAPSSGLQQPHQMIMGSSNNEYGAENTSPILENLEVLHLGYNGIKDIASVQLSRLTSLKALFLQGNEIQEINGLENLHELRELVLDKNRIKGVSERSFVNQWHLHELHLEENRIKDLSNLHPLESLQRLYLGMNRIQDLAELDKLEPLARLAELSVVSNPVSRRLLHRSLLVYRMPSLIVIDGIVVSDEERIKADAYYSQQEQQVSLMQDGSMLPGIASTVGGPLPPSKASVVPVKVTNVSLGGFGERVPWSGTLQYDTQLLQAMSLQANNGVSGDDRITGGARAKGVIAVSSNQPVAAAVSAVAASNAVNAASASKANLSSTAAGIGQNAAGYNPLISYSQTVARSYQANGSSGRQGKK